MLLVKIFMVAPGFFLWLATMWWLWDTSPALPIGVVVASVFVYSQSRKNRIGAKARRGR